MNDTITIMVHVSTDKVGSECEKHVDVGRDEWESMSEEERETFAFEWAHDMIYWNWEEV